MVISSCLLFEPLCNNYLPDLDDGADNGIKHPNHGEPQPQSQAAAHLDQQGSEVIRHKHFPVLTKMHQISRGIHFFIEAFERMGFPWVLSPRKVISIRGKILIRKKNYGFKELTQIILGGRNWPIDVKFSKECLCSHCLHKTNIPVWYCLSHD